MDPLHGHPKGCLCITNTTELKLWLICMGSRRGSSRQKYALPASQPEAQVFPLFQLGSGADHAHGRSAPHRLQFSPIQVAAMSEERACVAAQPHLHVKHVKLERYPPSPMISPGRARPRQLVVHQGFSTHGSLLAVAVMAARRQACSRTQFMQSVMQAVILIS